jgi:transposase
MNSQGRLARRLPMPMPIAPHIILPQNARTDLQTLARAHATPQSLALRARIVLRAADLDRPTNLKIGHELGCSNLTVGKWRRRYLALGIPGLQDAMRSGRPRAITPPTRVQVISVASTLPQDQDRPVTRWTLEEIAQVSGVSCKTSISSPTKVRTGSTATTRTLMPKPTPSASSTPRRLRPTSKVVW